MPSLLIDIELEHPVPEVARPRITETH